jgi:3-deoxy-manno-octulosonate cytidylyltransferase (CMP-KDO synthetase)
MTEGEPASAGTAAFLLIPARFASTRYPGKPLVRLRGAGGAERTLVEWTWRTGCAVLGRDRVFVATDDRRIAAEVERFGGQVLMTPESCRNGTERCAAALDLLPEGADLILNLQGDAPLTPPAMLAGLLQRMTEADRPAVATPAVLASGATLRHLLEEQDRGRVGGTTVVFDRRGRALYFSKAILPFGAGRTSDAPVHLHLGVYAYRRDALRAYAEAPPSAAELSEGLEQLRFLDRGVPVEVVVFPAAGTQIELNNPEDRPAIEAELIARGRE